MISTTSHAFTLTVTVLIKLKSEIISESNFLRRKFNSI